MATTSREDDANRIGQAFAALHGVRFVEWRRVGSAAYETWWFEPTSGGEPYGVNLSFEAIASCNRDQSMMVVMLDEAVNGDEIWQRLAADG